MTDRLRKFSQGKIALKICVVKMGMCIFIVFFISFRQKAIYLLFIRYISHYLYILTIAPHVVCMQICMYFVLTSFAGATIMTTTNMRDT